MHQPSVSIGLGNPGAMYVDTYHNVGFRVVEMIAARHQVRIRNRCGAALVSSLFSIRGQDAVLVLPQTFMNGSGAVLSPVFEKFGAGKTDLVVVYDDIALPIGKIRIRKKGTSGGHNGVKSLVSALGSDEFVRVRVGIQPDEQIDGARDFVLSPVSLHNKEGLNGAEDLAVDAVETIVGAGVEKAMAAFNGRDLRAEEEKDR